MRVVLIAFKEQVWFKQSTTLYFIEFNILGFRENKKKNPKKYSERLRNLKELCSISRDFLYLTSFVTRLELLHHSFESAYRNIVARIHARVSRSYDKHVISPVSRFLLWIPNRKSKLVIFNCT